MSVEGVTSEPLGDFRLIREVGRGGMGIVYEAEQISLNRRVALKVLPFAATMDPRHLQRFRNEAQAAACLHHPNIVPVYGVGCERGVHYYAMQFIDGQTLAQVIAEIDARRQESNHRRTEDTEIERRNGPVFVCALCVSVVKSRLLPPRRRTDRPGRRRPRVRPLDGRRPPRHQARQPDARQRRPPLDHRLRPRQAQRRRRRHDHDRRPDRHAALHVAPNKRSPSTASSITAPTSTPSAPRSTNC